MLAAMTLALAHSSAAPAFNATFYATMAGVIPVLFLAIAVQGNAYQDMLKAASRMARTTSDALAAPEARAAATRPRIRAAQKLLLLIPRLMAAFACLIALAGFLGEIDAIFALEQSRDDASTRFIVLFSGVILTCAVVIAPAQAAARMLQNLAPENRITEKSGPVREIPDETDASLG
jgi:hypothetical protein